MTASFSARPSSSLRALKLATLLSSTVALGLLASACGGTDDNEAALPPPFIGNGSNNNPANGGVQPGVGQGNNQAEGTNNNGQVGTVADNTQVGAGTNENQTSTLPVNNNQNTQNNNAGSQNTGAGGSAGVDDSQIDNSQDPNGAAGGAMVGAGGGEMVGTGGGGMVDDGQNNDGQNNDPQDNGNQQPTAGADTVCPANAIFCSGFEGNGLPEGTTFAPGYLNANGQVALGNEIFLDSTQSNSGSQSLLMPVDGNFYRMLAVPTPSSYWVRLYTRSDVGFGAPGSTHAAIFMGSVIGPDGDYNGDTAVEIAEQFDQILLNVKDSLFGTSGTNPNGQQGTTLPNNQWVCMEAQFDGPSGDVHVYVEGDEIIDASGWRGPADFQSFRFGYLRYSSPARDVWMDDVVVAPTRIGCL